MTKRKTFSQEFKPEAIRLMESCDRKSAELVRELGAPHNRLYKWREKLQAVSHLVGVGQYEGGKYRSLILGRVVICCHTGSRFS